MELKTATFSKLPCTNLRRAATIPALQKRRLFCYYRWANSDGGTTRGYRDQAQCACGMRCFCLCQRDPTGGLLSFESAIRKKGMRGLPKKVELGTVGALLFGLSVRQIRSRKRSNIEKQFRRTPERLSLRCFLFVASVLGLDCPDRTSDYSAALRTAASGS